MPATKAKTKAKSTPKKTEEVKPVVVEPEVTKALELTEQKISVIEDKSEAHKKEKVVKTTKATKKTKAAKSAKPAKATKSTSKTSSKSPKASAKKKTEPAPKQTVQKPSKAKKAKKSVEKSVNHLFEINGEQISAKVIEDKIYEAHKADGHNVGSIKELNVYYNFDERKAYYVINGKAENKFVEF